MDICTFGHDYIDSVYEIESSVFFDAYSKMTLMKMCDNRLYKFSLVLKIEDNVIGYILATDVYGEAEVLRICVKDCYRNKGYASVLLNYYIGLLRKNSVEKIFLEVRQNNFSAISLYEKFGFVKIDIRKNYYSDNNENAYVYVLETDKAVINC